MIKAFKRGHFWSNRSAATLHDVFQLSKIAFTNALLHAVRVVNARSSHGRLTTIFFELLFEEVGD